MRTRLRAAILIALMVGAPAAAQVTRDDDAGVQTETQRRRASGNLGGVPWDLVGLIGVFGLLGLRRSSDNDSYTDDPI